ncbi:MAG: hypothetical protein V3U37_00690 [Nitrospinaceae bacterium]
MAMLASMMAKTSKGDCCAAGKMPGRVRSLFRQKRGPEGNVAGLLLMLLICLAWPANVFAKFIQLDGVVDVKSRFSAGCSTVQELGEIAQFGKVDVLVFGDYARDSMEYGIFPFERIFKKKQEKSSVLTSGAAAYVAEVNDNDRQIQETVLVPAVEVAPFYYWTGNPFDKTLVAHNWDKHLLVVGMEAPEDIEQLPILNSNFSKNFIAQYQVICIGLAVLFLAALGAAYKGYYRKVTIPVAALLLLGAVNNHPFQSSPFNQYNGDKGIEPYQAVIDYVRSKEGMVFWNHMETNFSQTVAEDVGGETLPHSEDLVLSRGYTGFQTVTGDPSFLMESDSAWDHVLNEYVRGERKDPAWGYGGNNFTCEDEGRHKFGMARTIFLVREKSREAVLDAMRSGRMYAVHQPGDDRLSLDEFTVSDKVTGHHAEMGEELLVTDFPEIKVKVHTTKGGGKTARFIVIRNGKEVKQETAALPYELNWRDVEVDKSGVVYYRVNVIVDINDHIVSNPIFVRFVGEPPEVASLPPEGQKPEMKSPTVPTIEEPMAPAVPGMEATRQPSKPAKRMPKAPPAPPTPTRAPAPSPIPAASKPEVPRISEPVMSEPAAPQSPTPASVSGQTFVVARIDGVSLKKGPGTVFPEVAKAQKGERLALVRRTTVKFNGKPWLVVKKDGRNVYVWEGLVQVE